MFDGAAELNRPAAAAARHVVWLGRVKQGWGGAVHWPAAVGRDVRGHGVAPFRKRQAFVGRSARTNSPGPARARGTHQGPIMSRTMDTGSAWLTLST